MSMTDEAGYVWYRCRGCGRTRALPTGRARFHSCQGCGDNLWARVGSLAEQYEFLQEPDVCRVGEHRAAAVEEYRLIRPFRELDDDELMVELVFDGDDGDNLVDEGEPHEEPVRVVEISVRACPQHAAHLARGYHGFVLPQ
jgi:hypothetical protein